MRFNLELEALGYRDVAGRFAKRTDELQKQRRELGRQAGRVFVQALKKHAPKRTGEFAKHLFYRTYDRGSRLEVRFYAGGPHAFVLPFLTEGTRPHVIPTGGSAAQMAKGYPLRFFWEKGPRGPGIYHYWSVNHPGTKPNPFVDEARKESGEPLRRELQKAAARVAWL